MTFDPEKWIKESWKSDDEKTIKIAGEDVRIRRLKGTQWEQYLRAASGRSEDSAMVVVLQHGLVKPFGQYTYEQMAKFYDASPVMADRIAGAILEFTNQQFDAELKVLEDAEKNSATTDTSLPSTDGAENTVKTHNPPSSAEQNCSDLNATSG